MSEQSQENLYRQHGAFPGLKSRIKAGFQRIRQRYLVFLFFILLSAIGWFFLMLGETSVAYINYPIRYTDLPRNKILSQTPPDKLRLQVRADGYTILYNKIKLKRPLSYNVSAFQLYSLSLDSLSVYTLTRYALDSLTYELNRKNTDLQILDIYPDTLTFNFASVKKRKLPIAVRIRYNPDLFKRQYTFNGKPYCNPDSIIVTGPASLLDTLRFVYTTPLNLSNLSDTVVKKAGIEPVNDRVTIKTSRVEVTVPVDEFTEAEVDVPVVKLNVPDTILFKTFPDHVSVKYQVTMSNYDRVSPELFNLYIDYSRIRVGEMQKLPIQSDPLPSYLHNVKFSHNNVEYLIEKKNTESRSDRRNR